ncbi:MAG: hypothetical protein B6229_09420, partial [Spirochaetaceae bacterium 4572_7]
MRMSRILLCFFIFVIGSSLFGQSDEILDKLYEQENAQTLYASLVVLQASGDLPSDADIDDARIFLEGQKWGEAVLSDEEFITVGSFSLLVMESFKLPHGLMYNLLPIKRYALKEMLYQEYILGNPYPNDVMSSFNAIYVLSSLPVSEEMNLNYVDEE